MNLLSFVDLSTERLKMAKQVGADFPLVVTREDSAQEVAQRVAGMLGNQPHVTIECTGAESSIQTAIYVHKPYIHIYSVFIWDV